MNYLVDVLQGKSDERIQSNGHDKLSTFGIGKDMAVTEWKSLFRQLIALSYVNVDMERHGALCLTEKCRPVLAGKQRLQLRKQSQETIKTDKKKKSPVKPQDQALWDGLRALRLSLSEQAGVPPYVIFHDASLMDMIKIRPKSLADMGRVSGVGEQKLMRYGKEFLSEIEKHPLSELLNNRLSNTVNETLMLYQQKMDIEAIAKLREVKTSTIYTHLADAIEIGLLDVRDVTGLTDAEFNEIVFTLESQEDQEKGRLKPVFDELDGQYDYGLLRCVQAAI